MPDPSTPSSLQCAVLTTQLQEEKNALWAALHKTFAGCQETPEGFVLRYRVEAGTLESIGRLLALERTCCRFLRIRLELAPLDGRGPDVMALSLLGNAEVKSFLAPALQSFGIVVSPRCD